MAYNPAGRRAMMVAGPGDLANRIEGQGSQPGAAGGWRDAYRILSLAPRRLPATFPPSIILGLRVVGSFNVSNVISVD